MSEFVRCFDPRPPRGVWGQADAPCSYPDPPPKEDIAELLDAELRPSGAVMLHIRQPPATECAQYWELDAVVEGPAGDMGLRLVGGRMLVFAAQDRERVTAIVLKLANSHF